MEKTEVKSREVVSRLNLLAALLDHERVDYHEFTSIELEDLLDDFIKAIKKKNIVSRYAVLQEFIEGDFFRLHELPMDDPKFDATINKLNALVKELQRAVL